MATSSPDGISSALASTIVSVDTALDEAEQALRPYVVAPLKTALAKLDPLDSARLMTALAFSATSLLYGAYQRVQADACVEILLSPTAFPV